MEDPVAVDHNLENEATERGFWDVPIDVLRKMG